ncbi:MAG: ABC transporter permease, partial [Chloroflexi bacterium]|nr:ABC transporter permease [Chloroflexota bacterium]
DKNGELASEQSLLVTYLLPYIFGMLFMFAIFINSGFLMQSVSEEKENRVVEIMLSSVSSKQLLTGKIIGLGFAGLIQVAVWFIAIKIFASFGSANIPFLVDLSIPASMLLIGILYFVLGYLLFAALMAGLGSIGRTAREGQSWSTIFTLPAVIPIWFGSLIITNPYGVISRILTFFPLTAPITGMMRVPANTISAWEIILSLVMLALSVAAAIWVSAKIFRIGMLMHGKRPSIRDLARYIKSG